MMVLMWAVEGLARVNVGVVGKANKLAHTVVDYV